MTYINNRDLGTETFNQQLLNDNDDVIFIQEIIYITDSEQDSAVTSDFIE